MTAEISLENPDPLEKPSTRLACDILDVIQRYGQHLHSDVSGGVEWIGKSMFVARVEKQVELDQPINMILPSFPWKSVSRDVGLQWLVS